MTPIETDVIVVGAGNAALVTALAAADEGASVVVLEAANAGERGGNSRFSGGLFRFPHDGLESLRPLVATQPRADLSLHIDAYSPKQFKDNLVATSEGRADNVLLDYLVDQAFDTMVWMRDHGVEWEIPVGKLIDPDLVADASEYVVPSGAPIRAVGEGVGLVANLFAAAERNSAIEIRYDSPVHEILTSGNRVLGVRVRTDDGFQEFLGQVVLASGGFSANPEMRQRYLGPGWDLVKVRGTRFNMGNVLERALEIGAAAAGHYGGCHASPIDAHAPNVGDLRITDKMSRYSYPYAVLVNMDGKRFVDEGENEVWYTYAKTGSAIRAQRSGRAVQIFDQKTIHLLEPRYSTGTPVVADSLEELAGKLDIDASSLRATIDEFNAAVPDGKFDPFRRDGLAANGVTPAKSNWAQTIDRPPFVAYEVTCGITFTYGGVKIDERARVISQQWRPLKGLYATGEIAGDFFYFNYPAASGLIRGAVFGRIAGHEAATTARLEKNRSHRAVPA